uniref:Cation efflux protein transmembrane domain-containing protein n=1 Tax=Macrostomum lignano TaxID=282301 RepID=A0A1I8I7C2_9PLAT
MSENGFEAGKPVELVQPRDSVVAVAVVATVDSKSPKRPQLHRLAVSELFRAFVCQSVGSFHGPQSQLAGRRRTPTELHIGANGPPLPLHAGIGPASACERAPREQLLGCLVASFQWGWYVKCDKVQTRYLSVGQLSQWLTHVLSNRLDIETGEERLRQHMTNADVEFQVEHVALQNEQLGGLFGAPWIRQVVQLFLNLAKFATCKRYPMTLAAHLSPDCRSSQCLTLPAPQPEQRRSDYRSCPTASSRSEKNDSGSKWPVERCFSNARNEAAVAAAVAAAADAAPLPPPIENPVMAVIVDRSERVSLGDIRPLFFRRASYTNVASNSLVHSAVVFENLHNAGRSFCCLSAFNASGRFELNVANEGVIFAESADSSRRFLRSFLSDRALALSASAIADFARLATAWGSSMKTPENSCETELFGNEIQRQTLRPGVPVQTVDVVSLLADLPFHELLHQGCMQPQRDLLALHELRLLIPHVHGNGESVHRGVAVFSDGKVAALLVSAAATSGFRGPTSGQLLHGVAIVHSLIVDHIVAPMVADVDPALFHVLHPLGVAYSYEATGGTKQLVDLFATPQLGHGLLGCKVFFRLELRVLQPVGRLACGFKSSISLVCSGSDSRLEFHTVWVAAAARARVNWLCDTGLCAVTLGAIIGGGVGTSRRAWSAGAAWTTLTTELVAGCAAAPSSSRGPSGFGWVFAEPAPAEEMLVATACEFVHSLCEVLKIIAIKNWQRFDIGHLKQSLHCQSTLELEVLGVLWNRYRTEQEKKLVSRAFHHHPDAVGTFNGLHQVTMNTLMQISLVSLIKPCQWASLNRETSSASLSSIQSSPRRRRHLQQMTPGDYEHLDANFSSFADQASTSSLGRRRHLQQMTPGDYEHLDANFSSFTDQASTLVSQAFRHHPDAVGTFNRCRRRRDDDGMLERLAEGVRQLRLAYCRGLIGETREVRIKVFIVAWCHLLKVPTASDKTHRLGLMIIMALAYFAVELVVGHLCDSVTLVADSFHMLSDVLALIVALGAVRVGKKPRDAVQKIIEPHPMKDPKLIVYVGSGGLLINLIGILLFCGHSHGHGGHASEHSHQAELLMQHKSVEFLPEEARPMAQAAAAEAGDEPMKVECMDEQDNASPKRATAGATAAAAAASGAVATSSAAVPILIEQTSPAASTSAAHPVAPASDRASSPSLLAAVEHSVASLRRGSLGPSWLPNALPRPSEIDEVDQGEGDDVALDAGSGGGGGGGHGHSHEVGASRGSGHMNMQAAFLHIIGDTLGSVIVIVSAVTLWLAPPGYSLDLYEARAVLLGNDTCLIEEPGRRWQTYIDPSL